MIYELWHLEGCDAGDFFNDIAGLAKTKRKWYVHGTTKAYLEAKLIIQIKDIL